MNNATPTRPALWHATVNPRERFGVDRPAHLGSCDPAKWEEVSLLDECIVEGRVNMDEIASFEDPCMLRTVDAAGVWRSYSYADRKAVELPALQGLDGDPLGAWDAATDAEAMLTAVAPHVDLALLALTAVALARVAASTAALAPGVAVGERSKRAVVAAEAALRRARPLLDGRDVHNVAREALLDAAQVGPVGWAGWAAVCAATAAGNVLLCNTSDVHTEAVYAARQTRFVFERVGALPSILAWAVRGVIPTQAVCEALARQVTA